MVVKTKPAGAKGECQCASLIIDHLCAFYGNLPEEHAKDIRTSRAKSFSPASLRNDKQAIWKY